VHFFRNFFARGVHCFQFGAQGGGGVCKPETTRQQHNNINDETMKRVRVVKDSTIEMNRHD
jgi:hypothetical protein